jgi:hypothetical protein
MLVQIDEAGSHDQSFGVDRPATAQRIGRNGRNAPRAQTDISDGIQTGLGIHHAAVDDHDIVGVVRC